MSGLLAVVRLFGVDMGCVYGPLHGSHCELNDVGSLLPFILDAMELLGLHFVRARNSFRQNVGVFAIILC